MAEYTVQALTLADASNVWEVLRDDGGYCRRVEGREPAPRDAETLFTTFPPGVDEFRKHVIGMFDQGTLVAVADVVQGWPDETTNFIGLLHVKASRHGQGVATRLHEQIVRRYPAGRWRLSVVDTNVAVLPFWRSLGYEPTGEERPWLNDAGQGHTALILERVETTQV